MPCDDLFLSCCFWDSVFDFWKYDYVSQCVSLSSLNFLDVSLNLGSFQSLFRYSLYPFLSLFSFWDSHTVYIDLSDGVPQVPRALFIFLQSFCFHSSDSVISIVLYPSLLFLSYVSSNLPLNPISEYFISVIILYGL